MPQRVSWGGTEEQGGPKLWAAGFVVLRGDDAPWFPWEDVIDLLNNLAGWQGIKSIRAPGMEFGPFDQEACSARKPCPWEQRGRGVWDEDP